MPESKISISAVFSLILGLLSVVGVFCCVGYITGILSIVLGIVALVAYKNKEVNQLSAILAWAGIVISLLAMIFYGIFFLVIGIGNNPVFNKYAENKNQKYLESKSIDQNKNNKANNESNESSEDDLEEEQESYIQETCSELSKQLGPSSKLSDLQKDELWKQYKNKKFSWKLRVTEVSKGMFGGYNVQYKCASNSPSLIQDIMIEYPEHKKQFVLNLNKGEVYDITGRLTTTSSLLGMLAEDN